MRVLVQKVKDATCKVDGKIVGSTPFGLLVFVAFQEGDENETIFWLAKKIANLRIFQDENGVMNRSVASYRFHNLRFMQIVIKEIDQVI